MSVSRSNEAGEAPVADSQALSGSTSWIGGRPPKAGSDPFAAAVWATRMPMVVTDPRRQDNPIVFVNNSFCRLTGYSREEILGRNCRFLQGPETDPEAVRRIKAALAAAESIEIDIRNHRKDGTLFWNRLLIGPVRDESGAVTYFFASQVDVSLERERVAGLETHNAALVAELADRLRSMEEGEARLRFATQAGRIGVWDLEPATMRLTASDIFKEQFGFQEQFRQGADAPMSYADMRGAIHPDDRARVDDAVERSLATGADYDLEYRLSDAAGAGRWLAASGRPVFDGAKTPVRLAGVVVDITARKQAEFRQTVLLELTDRLRDLGDPAELSFATSEVLGRAFGVSRAGYGTIDVAAETITIERDWNAPGVSSLAGTLRFRDYGSYIEDLKRGETVVFADAELDPRTAATAGALEAISARAAVNMPVSERGGLVALLYLNHATARVWTDDELSLIREVAARTRIAVERNRAETALRQLNATLETQVAERTRERDRVWRNSRDLLLVVGPDGLMRAVNPAWTRILGYAPTDLVGRSVFDFILAEDAGDSRDALSVAAGTRDLTNFENRYRHKDGSLRWIAWHTSFEDDAVYAYGRDVTGQREQADALRRSEEQLRQAQKMEAVGQLTGGLAHDFNNLLTSISGSLELLQVRLSQGRLADFDRYLSAAQGAARRAAALTHRLLAFSRRQTLDPKPTDVNKLVRGMEELVRRTVGPAVAIEVVGAVGLWPTLVDPGQLENALLNLCINARDAMPDGGRITIETANTWLDERAGRERDLPPGQYVSLSVSDTGAGMTPEVIARAFDPFFTTKPIGQGTGLGLSMVYGFARQSNGQVRIYSEVGQGTNVCVYLPRSGRAESGVGELDDLIDAPRAEQGETVLVVDDEPTVRMLVTEVLEDLGYTAIEAMDGNAGLRVLQSDARIDLLVTDVGLPGGMNGRQVADAGRAIRPGLKVLFITGYAENAVVGNGHLDPGMHVLTKPFAMETLARRIRELVSG